jgi:hypothetical protein
VTESRFNNVNIRHLIEAEGIQSRHLVPNKLSDSPSSGLFFDVPGRRKATNLAGRLETRLSVRLQYQSFSRPTARGKFLLWKSIDNTLK